jgi:hypothetical protein
VRAFLADDGLAATAREVAERIAGRAQPDGRAVAVQLIRRHLG